MNFIGDIFNSLFMFVILCGMLVVLRDIFESTILYTEGEGIEEEIDVLGVDELPTGEKARLTSVEIKLTPQEVSELNYGQSVMIIARLGALGMFASVYYFIFQPLFN